MEKLETALNNALTPLKREAVDSTKALPDDLLNAIKIQMRRLISHFPTNRTPEEWATIQMDYCVLLAPFPLERIAAAVNEHIKTGEFFPKVSELINLCRPKFESIPPKNVLNPAKQVEWIGPNLETRKRGVAEWEVVKARFIHQATKSISDKPQTWREGGSDEFNKLMKGTE